MPPFTLALREETIVVSHLFTSLVPWFRLGGGETWIPGWGEDPANRGRGGRNGPRLAGRSLSGGPSERWWPRGGRLPGACWRRARRRGGGLRRRVERWLRGEGFF